MANTARIILNNLSFQLEHTNIQFDKINLSFQDLKYGIVGKNGIGKSTFLQLLLGHYKPNSGSIHKHGKLVSVPQSYDHKFKQSSITDVLGVSEIINALKRINNGSINDNDFLLVNNYWDIQQRIQNALLSFNLWPLDLELDFNSLSGGQKTKILLAKTMIFESDFLIFDEPTNNLDIQTRKTLYDYIEYSSKGMIIVSHDRALLNKLDGIVEINSHGLKFYGGNYDFYHQQKIIEEKAQQQHIHAQQEILNKSKQSIQNRMERHQQNQARGRKEKNNQVKAKGRYDKIELNSKKGRSENTNKRIRLQAQHKLDLVESKLKTAKVKIDIDKGLNIQLDATKVANNKVVLKIKELNFNYEKQTSLIKNFNLTLIGPQRIAIAGANGCGKSTLMKLIKNDLKPTTGTITLGVDQIAYLDQTVSFLNSNLSIVDNFRVHNPQNSIFEAYSALATFKFRNLKADQMVKNLSGGEKIRAGLAVCLSSSPAPQLIILDEPTNHLDLEAIAAIEEALSHFQGAIIAISHDKSFLKNIGVNKVIEL